ENLRRNFGMPHPEGYRKALRLMQLADKFGRPIVTLIDTPGAYPGIGAEERGQAEAIARNLREMARLHVPIVAAVIGEGGSGGAHTDPESTAAALRSALIRSVRELKELDPATLRRQRWQKYESLGAWREVAPAGA